VTIVSKGYTGTIAPNVDWANVQASLGNTYWVGGSNPAGPVTGSSDGTRHVTVGTGTMGGQGIWDNITAAETITLSSVATNTYFMIVAHRDYSASTTTIAAVSAGTTLPTVLPTRTNNPGVVDEQPLALVMLTSSGTVTVIYDLRNIGAKDKFSMDANLSTLPAWFSYLPVGSTVVSGNVTWYNDAFNGWVADPTVVISGPSFGNPLSITPITGWASSADLESHGVTSGPVRSLNLLVRHSSTSNPITFSSTSGNAIGTNLTPINVGNTTFQPPRELAVPFLYTSTDGGAYAGTAFFTTSGNFIIESGAPNTSIAQQSSGTYSIRSSFTWIAET
jgi:hypothetical protein